MIKKHVNDIVINDIYALVGNACEQYDMEFKTTLNIKTESQKKEFLADVSSFANASGGDLIYGIVESGGKAVGISGMPVLDADQVTLAAENLIRAGIDERIAFDLRYYELGPGCFVFLIRVYEGPAKPHQVCLAGTGKYYARGNAGKYQLDHAQIKTAIEATSQSKNQIKQFIDDRFNQIGQGLFPVPLHPNGLVALILIPSRTFDPYPGFDLDSPENKLLPPMNGGGHTPSYNGMGMLSTSGYDRPTREAYLQIRKNGILETVNSTICWVFQGQKILPASGSHNYEKVLVGCIINYLSHYDKLVWPFPCIVG